MDKTSFWWTGLCGICHTGGGPTEFDRDGQKYYDIVTGEFGYEKLGKTANDVLLDGDYSEVSNKTGALSVARWDKTGVSEHDCLYCHRSDRDLTNGPVSAFAAAPTAAQGWISGFGMAAVPAGKPPLAAFLDINYGTGLGNGSLTQKGNDLYVSSGAIAESPKDFACWGCHNMADSKKRGRSWFNPDLDVHYKAFNKLNDADATNDIPASQSTACMECHPGGMDGMKYNHNFAKGSANLGTARDDTDFEGFRTCRECHAADSQVRHPDAPVPPDVLFHDARHTNVMSCEVCHIPYKVTPADIAVDNSVTGSTVSYKTNIFLSADPQDPENADKSRWYPSFTWKKDTDGVSRVFPAKLLLSAWWGDWDQNGTPNDKTDDQIKPLPLWRVRGITKGAPLAGVADNNVNTEAEIRTYIDALRGNDVHGNQVAANPVLVKGGMVWHDDGAGGVTHFEYHDSGIKTESSHPFSVSHNVRSGSDALGAAGCSDCHGGHSTPVFDRKILVDPFGPDGKPIYKTVRELLSLNPH
jgi:hypothetical protein